MVTDTNEAIVVDGLTKKYGRHRGVEDVTLTVAYGEIIGFLGPNGSGKTTVLRTIMGLLQPTHGRVSVGGVPVTSDPRIWRASTGYLPGELELPPNMTVWRYLEFLTRLRRLSCDDEIDRLAQRLRLDLTARISGLSKGNRQKVGVVQALMHRPSIVVLDEPTSGLDPIAQEEFAQLLDERRQEGTAVVLSTHVLHEVEAVADRVVILDEGRVLAVDTVDRLRERIATEIRLSFENSVDAVRYQTCAGVTSVSVEGLDVIVRATVPHTEVLRQAVGDGVVKVVSHEPTLSDVFIALTRSNHDS